MKPGPSPLRRRIILFVSGALIVAGVVMAFHPSLPAFFSGRGSHAAERVLELPYQERVISVTRQGKLYKAVQEGDNFRLLATSLAEGKTTSLAHFAISDQVVLTTLFAERDALIFTRPKPSPTPTPSPVMGNDSGKPRVGPNRTMIVHQERLLTDPPARLMPGQTRQTVKRRISRESRPALLYRVPLNGEPFVKNEIDTRGYDLDSLVYLLTTKGLVWVLPRVTTFTSVRDPQTFITEVSPRDDLMLSPLDGGRARVLRKGVQVQSLSSLPSPAAVSLNGFFLGGPSKRWEYLVSLEDTHAAPKPVSQGKPPNPSVELDGCRYWLETRFLVEDSAEGITPETPQSGRVWCSSRDGKERRIVWEGRDTRGEPMLPRTLLVTQNRLYVVYAPSAQVLKMSNIPVPPGKLLDYGYRLARLHPERTNPLGEARILAPGMELDIARMDRPFVPGDHVRVDGDYLYALVPEARSDTKPDVISVYRVLLPD
jgi:hypothetical protein